MNSSSAARAGADEGGGSPSRILGGLTLPARTSMNEDLRERIRDEIMHTFREWGGQWNVTVQPPAEGGTDLSIRVHSRPVTRGVLPIDLARAYLDDPESGDVRARWEAQLHPIYERALTPEAD